MSELSRERIIELINGDRESPQEKLILCDMALAHLDSKEAGRVSVPREALEAMRDCARELSKKADQHMLGICSPAALALPAVALAGEINDLLSAAPAPADQVKHDDAGGRQE